MHLGCGSNSARLSESRAQNSSLYPSSLSFIRDGELGLFLCVEFMKKLFFKIVDYS